MDKNKVGIILLYIVITVLFVIGNTIIFPLYLLWVIKDSIWEWLGWNYELE